MVLKNYLNITCFGCFWVCLHFILSNLFPRNITMMDRKRTWLCNNPEKYVETNK